MTKKLLLPIICLTLLSVSVSKPKSTPPPPVTQEEPAVTQSFAVQAAEPIPDVPVKITIPNIGVESNILTVGLTPEKIVDTPDTQVGWYHGLAKPGEIGMMSLNGHFQNSKLQPGVFHDLSKLHRGDEIIVTDKQDRHHRYQVTETELVDVHSFPLQKVYGQANQALLNLITCAGEYDSQTKDYTQRTIVYAQLVN